MSELITKADSRPQTRRVIFASPLFIVNVLSFTLLALAAVMAINLLVDPLWYFSGNRITGKNLFFNEREAKVNLYLKLRDQFDCVLLGASSATTLDVADIDKLKCFNFSFSGGTLEEFVAYARYVKAVGRTPTSIVISVDYVNYFADAPSPASIPDFVQSLGKPKPFVEPYLTIEVLSHSLRELLTAAHDERYYRAGSFVCVVDPNHRPFIPPAKIRLEKHPREYSVRRFEFITQIRNLFPSARLIGYTPYVNSWWTARAYFQGQLGDLAEVRYEMAKHFDDFYDFGIPSSETESVVDTYDGFHYGPTTNRAIARALSGSPAEGSVRPLSLSKAEYVALYRNRTADFISRRKLTSVQ